MGEAIRLRLNYSKGKKKRKNVGMLTVGRVRGWVRSGGRRSWRHMTPLYRNGLKLENDLTEMWSLDLRSGIP